MQAVERDRAKLEAIRAAQEQFTPTPAQSAYLSAMFAPGSGIVDAAGQFPEFPSSDVALVDAFSGDPMPSIAENIAAGGIDRYLFAPLQAVGVAGDALYATNPFIAGLPKGIATLGAVARAAGKADKGRKAGEIISLDEFIDLASKGEVKQFRNNEDSAKALINKESKAQDFEFEDMFEADEYESGEFTKKLEDAGLYVEDNMMGKVIAGQTKQDVENLKKAQNPYEFGKSYGYSEPDIAAFYINRRGGNAQLGYEDFIQDAPMQAKTKKTPQADKKGIKALRAEQIQQDINAFARDSEGFVSPSLEALLSKAPPNHKGKQITEWLKANAKPKELEFLGVDEFIANNPNASVREVAEGVSQNKVEVGKNVYRGDAYGSAELDFDVTTPEFDPLDPDYLNYQYRIDDIKYSLGAGDLDEIQYFADQFAANRMTPDEIASYGDEFTFEDLSKRVSRDYASGQSNETLDDVIEELARDEYFDNPYEMVQARQINAEGNVDELPGTFAFGNEEVGYQLFANGQRVTPEDIAYSQTEAKLQLQQIINEEDLLDIDAVSGGARYKGFVDESLPGGDNYREIVYTWKNAPTEHRVSDHFDEPNQISHALVRDRKLADGSSSLHVDELQSDLHTKGKQAGYSTPELDMEDTFKLGKMSSGISTEFTKLKNRILPKLEDAMGDRVTIGSVDINKIKRQIADAEKLYAKSPQDRFSLIRMNDARRIMFDAINSFNELGVGKGATLEDIAAFTPFDEAIRPALELAQAQSARVPNYPFKGDDWYKMSLKQLLKDAVEEGKDTISVSGSAPMIARYSDKYEKFYKSLYDQKIPSAMKKLANTYGGKFERGKLDFDDTFGEDPSGLFIKGIANNPQDELVKTNIIRITPEMKQKILEEGLPSFRMGGSVNNFIAPEDINIFA